MTPVRAHHYVRLIYFRFCDRPCDRIPCFLFSLERSARKHTHTQHIAHHALIHPSCTDGPIMPANAISMLTKIYSSITILTTHMMTWQRWVNTTTQPDCISGAVYVHVCEYVIAVFASNHQASFCGFRIEHVYVVACIKPEMIWFFFICCCNVSVTAALAGGMQQCGWYEMCTWIWRCVCTRRSFSRAATVSSVTAYSKQCITQQTLQWQGSNLIVFISANVYLHFNIPLHSIETKTISNL